MPAPPVDGAAVGTEAKGAGAVGAAAGEVAGDADDADPKSDELSGDGGGVTNSELASGLAKTTRVGSAAGTMATTRRWSETRPATLNVNFAPELSGVPATGCEQSYFGA